MKNRPNYLFFALAMFLFSSCYATVKIDPVSLYNEIGRSATTNTLAEQEY
ncbi:MAG: hypothetical protein FD181_3536 [Prolixibacteraceae bacterium]|nr:MAG: hypothetical protein FD181_3536 [Prolixibacteraceae bacterium]